MNTKIKLPTAKARHLNSYDTLHEIVSSKPAFNQEAWVSAANDGALDLYIDDLFKSDKIADYEAYKDKYNLDYADGKTHRFALHNEVAADTQNSDTKRKRTIVDNAGNEIEEEYFASDYEYNLQLIRQQNDYLQQLRQREIAQDIKNSMNAGEHILSGIVGVGTNFASGVLSGVDNLIALGGAAGELIAAQKGTKIDTFVESLASNKYRPFADDIQEIVNFESNYTSMRDIDGNYSNYGKYIGGVATSLGEMLPSMIIGKGAGKAFSSAGASAKVARTAGSIAAQGSFYAGMSAGNVQDTFLQYQQNGADIDSALILANSAIKSTLQWAVEYGLGKILGPTSLDNMVFGRAQTGITSKTLTKAGLLNILKDAGQEGLEEVLQDTSDFLVDEGFEYFIRGYKNHGDISWQSLMDAFIIGAISSVAGSARNIITSKSVIGTDGKKLNKIASWQYGLDMNSLVESLNVIEESAAHFRTNEAQLLKQNLSDKERNNIKLAAVEAYASYRMITSIYEEIGEERFKAANDVLEKMTTQIKSGVFTAKDAISYVDSIRANIRGIAESSLKKIAEELLDGAVTKTEKIVNKEDPTSEKADTLAKMLDVDSVITTDGSINKTVDKTHVIDKETFDKSSVGDILKTQAIADLVNSVVDNFGHGPVFDRFVDAYKQYASDDSPSKDLVARALLFDKDFFTATLLTENKDAYKLLSYFSKLVGDIKPTTVKGQVERKQINDILNNWYNALSEFCIIHPEADPSMFLQYVHDYKKRKQLSDKIKRERWTGEIYVKILNNPTELSNTDKEVLKRRIAYAFPANQVDIIFGDLLSNDSRARAMALNKVSFKYDNIFNNYYDGKTYARDISIGNRVFNKFLFAKNLTIKSLLDSNKLNSAESAYITEKYGSITDKTILSFRQEQFSATNSGYEFVVNDDNTIDIFSNKRNVGFVTANKNISSIIDPDKLSMDKRTVPTSYSQRDKFINGLLRDDMPAMLRDSFTITDVILHPEKLKESVKNDIVSFIKSTYGYNVTDIDSNTLFSYLSIKVLENYKNKSLAVLEDGSIGIANLVPMDYALNDFELREDLDIADVFKSDFVPKGLKLVISESDLVGFNGYKYEKINGLDTMVIDNSIYLPKSFLKLPKDYVRFVLAHEFHHAIQFEKHMNHGFYDNWTALINDTLLTKIIKDVKNHMPQLFENAKGNRKIEEDIVRNFVYYGSGESYAYGLANSKMLDYYPVIVRNTVAGTEVVFPWGTHFRISDDDINVQVTDLSDTVLAIAKTFEFPAYKLDLKAMQDMKSYRERQSDAREIIYNNTAVSDYLDTDTYDRDNEPLFKNKLKNALLANDEKLKNLMLDNLYVDLNLNLTYDAFLNTDLPFITIEGVEKDDIYKVAFIDKNYNNLANKVVNYALLSGLRPSAITIKYGTIKPKNVYGYIDTTDSQNIFIPSDTSVYEFNETVEKTKFVPETIVNRYDESVESVIKPIDSNVREPKANTIAEDDPRAKNFVHGGKSPNAKYIARYFIINNKGEQVLLPNGKPAYHYEYPPKTRYVGKRKWQGTKLEAFAKNEMQIEPDMQKFILNAEGLDPILQEKIDGPAAGTLTREEVMDYFRSKKNIDDVTFKAINKHFFHNDYIDNMKELNDLIFRSPEAWALWRVAKLVPSLHQYVDELSDREMSINLFQDIVTKDSAVIKYKKSEFSTSEAYANLLAQYYNIEKGKSIKSIKIPETYYRYRLMTTYDGSIKSHRDAVSVVRLAGILNEWKSTERNTEYDVIDESYDEALESLDMRDDEIIAALGERFMATKAKEMFDNAGEEFNAIKVASKVKALTDEYVLSLENMTRAELVKAYGGETKFNNAVIEGVIVSTTGKYIALNDNLSPKAANYVRRIKSAVNTMKKHLDGKARDNIRKKYPKIFDANFNLKDGAVSEQVDNKTKPGKHVKLKSIEELSKLEDLINKIKEEVLVTSKSTKRQLAEAKARNKILKREIKRLEKGVKSDGKTPHVVEIITDEGVEHLAVEKEMPLQLMKLLQVHYNRTAKTAVKNLSEDGERHLKMMANTFYENSDEILLNLTQSDVDAIIDFFVNGIVNYNDATAPYQTAAIWTMTYLVQVGRTGGITKKGENVVTPVNFVVSADQLNKLEHTLEHIISRSAKNLTAWRSALKKLDPIKTMHASFAHRVGVTPTEEELTKLLNATRTGDPKEIEAVKKEVYDAMRIRYMKNNADKKGIDRFLDRILQWERLAMLSGPGTWVRNASSNFVIQGSNWLIDKTMPGFDKVLEKLFKKSYQVKDQYKIAGTVVTKDVADYIQTRLIDSKLLSMSVDGLSKYDTRPQRKGNSDSEILCDLLASAVTSMANRQQLFTNKPMAKVESLLRKALADDPWVKKATIKYLGKMLTEDIASNKIQYKDVLSDGTVSKRFLGYVAEAYKLAAYDYMHKPNLLLHFESELAKKNFKAYFAYKQFLPFAGIGYNWFVEGLNYTPIGLAKAIINFAKLENTVEKMDNDRRTYKYGDTGLSSEFAAYVTKRNITKGVIGTIGFVAGALLAMFGCARLDEEDDKYKIMIGDVGVDVSDLFGTQGIFFGISLFSGIKNKESMSNVLVAALDQLFLDSTFSDVFNTFRYSQSFGDWLLYQTYAVPNMMIPNLLKTASSLSNVYSVKFSPGIQGKIERLCVNALPFAAYAMPHYYDPYTGEKQIATAWQFLAKFVDKLSPLGLSVYHVSDLEKLCIGFGINKTQLTGKYTINEESITLNTKDIERLNEFYGKLNVSSFNEMKSGRTTYKIQEKNGRYKTVTWNTATEKEKAAIVSRIMTNNSSYAKIYVLTDSGKYKYYASDSEYKKLRKLGITKNVYKASKDNLGFIKIR